MNNDETFEASAGTDTALQAMQYSSTYNRILPTEMAQVYL
jgi:hypothetical protein